MRNGDAPQPEAIPELVSDVLDVGHVAGDGHLLADGFSDQLYQDMRALRDRQHACLMAFTAMATNLKTMLMRSRFFPG